MGEAELTGVWGEGGHRYKGEPSALAYRLRRTHTWVRAGILCVCVCVCVIWYGVTPLTLPGVGSSSVSTATSSYSGPLSMLRWCRWKRSLSARVATRTGVGVSSGALGPRHTSAKKLDAA